MRYLIYYNIPMFVVIGVTIQKKKFHCKQVAEDKDMKMNSVLHIIQSLYIQQIHHIILIN